MLMVDVRRQKPQDIEQHGIEISLSFFFFTKYFFFYL